MNRREFIRTAGGTAGAVTAATAAGTAAGQEGNESSGSGSGGGSSGPIDYGGYLEGANNWGGDGSTVDATGQDEVTVEVGAGSGGLAFEPAGVRVDPGATVVFEWTGEGGAHNVQTDGNQPVDFESQIVGDEGFTFELDVPSDASGIVQYFCSPHQGQGMLGALAVGEVPRKSTGGPVTRTDPEPREMGVPIQPHWVGIGTLLMMVASLTFTFFLLKYGESPHTKGGNN